MPLRLRRGTNAERLTITPLEGELIYTTDTKQVYVGDSNTVGGNSITSSSGGPLNSSLSLNGYNITGTGDISIVGSVTASGGTYTNGTATLGTNLLETGTLSFNGSTVTSSDNFIAGSGNTIGNLFLGSQDSPLQIIRNYKEAVEPIDIKNGITNGFFSLVTNNNVSRGTLVAPTSVLSGDCLSYNRVFGYDGYSYVSSSSIWQGVDPEETVTAGTVPGAIAFTVEGILGQKVLSFNSKGFLGINKFPEPAIEALDVSGNGLFSGSVTATSLIGPIYGTDSSLYLDGTINWLTNGVLTFDMETITSNVSYNSVFTGNPINLMNIGLPSESLQTVRFFNEAFDPYEAVFGISNGPSALVSNRYTSRGTVTSPTVMQAGDAISGLLNFAYDGSNYALSSFIRFGVDDNAVITPGIVPGDIAFLTTKSDGSFALSAFTAEGKLGINLPAGTPPETTLDVYGEAIIRNTLNIKHDIASDVSKIYSIANGFAAGGITSYNTSRGTLTSPTVVQGNDTLAAHYSYGFDGTSYAISSGISCSVDGAIPVSTGFVPGQISFLTLGINGFANTTIGSSGSMVVRADKLQTSTYNGTDEFVVLGRAWIENTVTASAFSGSLISNDSMVVFDDATGAVQGSTVSSMGYVMFGSYDAAGRTALTAANGMVIYNTTANRFQGYQNGAWINLDDGTAAP